MSSLGAGRAAARRAPPGRSPPGDRSGAAARASRSSSQAGVDVPVAVLDEPVGVEHQPAALGQLQLGGLEGQAAEAERRAGGQVGELDACRRGGPARAAGGRPGPWCSCRETGS